MDVAMAVTGVEYSKLIEGLPQLEKSGAAAVEVGWNLFEQDDATLCALGSRLARAGTPVRSVHAPFGDAGDLAALDPEERAKALASHEDLLRRAYLLGATLLIIHPGRMVDDESLIPQMERLVRDSVARLLPLAERQGVVLALENMLPRHPATATETLLAIVREADSPLLQVCFDTGHAHVGDGVMPVFSVLAPHVVTIHLTDNDTWHDGHLQPPYGTIDWGAFIRALNASGYRQPLTIETPPWGGASPRRMIEEVQALLNTHGDGTGATLPRLATTGNEPMALLRCLRCGHFLIETEGGRTCSCNEV